MRLNLRLIKIKPFQALLIVTIAAVGFGLLLGFAGTNSAQTGIDIAIDTDVTGNDARLSGGANIQTCNEISGTGTLEIDVVLPPPGVDAADGIKAWQFDLRYDPAVVNVTAENQSFLLDQAPGSTLLALSDAVPESEGTFTSSVADIGIPPDIEPAGVHEVGPGVLVRITLTAVAPGISTLTLADIIAVAAVPPAPQIGQITVNPGVSAMVVVDGSCLAATAAPTPSPTASPSPTPPPTLTATATVTATVTPTPTPTPTPKSTPPASTPGDCTGDGGDPNIVDVLRLLRHVRDPSVPLSCEAGDCTGDGGESNIVDVLRLLRNLRDPNVPLSC